MAYYLKYRPQDINDIDLVSVREYLKKIFVQKNIPHAYLFTGPKGIGKTSAARIVAKILNCQKKKDEITSCNKCSNCLTIADGTNIDVVEIDAASHRSIEDVRALKDAVKLSPLQSTNKIFILDEAHMLTTEASNALLKTLEEPPQHVYFILATTNPEKLIPTIVSRTTEVKFVKASAFETEAVLKKIVKKEKLELDSGIIKLIAKSGEGSFRDSVKMLESIVMQNITSEEEIHKFIKGGSSLIVDDLIITLLKRDEGGIVSLINSQANVGADVKALVDALIEKVRTEVEGIISGESSPFTKDELFLLFDLLMKAKEQLAFSLSDEVPFLIALIKWINMCGGGNKNQEHIEEIQVEQKEDVIEGGELSQIGSEEWARILLAVKPHNASIESLLRSAKPMGINENTLSIGVYYSFHKDRLEEQKHKVILENVLTEIYSSPMRIKCVLTKAPENATLTTPQGSDIIDVAKKVFGV